MTLKFLLLVYRVFYIGCIREPQRKLSVLCVPFKSFDMESFLSKSASLSVIVVNVNEIQMKILYANTV